MPIDELNNKTIRDSMHGEGPEDEILSELNTDTISRKSITTLRAGEWLNDEVIKFCMSCLANRDHISASPKEIIFEIITFSNC